MEIFWFAVELGLLLCFYEYKALLLNGTRFISFVCIYTDYCMENCTRDSGILPSCKRDPLFWNVLQSGLVVTDLSV